MFKDEVEIEVRAGRGGNGAVSMRREKAVPYGGPDGGDGGDGGSVVFVASHQLNSLLPLAGHYHYVAPDGRPGGGQMCSGKSGEDLVIDVPIGTQIFDKKWGNLLRDLAHEGMRLQIARGGRGGQGNARFATSVRQTPRFAQNGTRGESRDLRLELKLFAEAGLVGLPNAGKSTLLAAVTAATPKIADYPFTTLSPQVGIARLAENDTLVLADLPGLIEGAAEGHGLGHRFLRHVERCRVLLHLVDVSDSALEDPDESRRVIEGELERYSAELAARPRLLVATKCESPDAHERADLLEQAAGVPVVRISSVERRGLQELLRAAWNIVHTAPAATR